MTDNILWQPTQDQVQATAMYQFMETMNTQHGLALQTYLDLWQWSVENLELFWTEIWDYFEVIGQKPTSAMLTGQLPDAQWGKGAKVNYAENILRHAHQLADTEAVVGLDESLNRTVLTWKQLNEQVGAFAHHLRSIGVGPGDVVAAAVPNIPQAIVALLGTAAVGAIWSVVNVDFGVTGIVSRFKQLAPKVLITIDALELGGKLRDQTDDLDALLTQLDSVSHHILVENAGPQVSDTVAQITAKHQVSTTRYADIIAQPREPEFAPVEFSHPLWVLYSSGTTGTPKGIVQGHGGTVLEIAKSFGLHYRVPQGAPVYISTSTTWMLWNMQVATLITGAKAVTYSGAVFAGGPGRQFEILAKEQVAFFGCGAAILTGVQESGFIPKNHYDLSHLTDILVSASPLPARTWRWVYDAVSPKLRLRSDSGGTDVCSVFVGSNPMDPVRINELMGPALGVAADVYDETGTPVTEQVGELVITKPMPTMPLYFWNDDDGARYRDAYFSQDPHIWYHGDFATKTDRLSFVIHGRSDATLNRGGIRMGSSDLYQIVDGLVEVSASMVIGAELDDGGYYMPLFVVPRDPHIDPQALKTKIIEAIRTELSPRYVPDEIIIAPGVPMTKTGKLMEVPIKRVFQGMSPEKVATETAAEPEVLKWFLNYASNYAQ
ncbi:MAG TPA: acetoacetate--CoA ligase [Enteractinococcus helveticum]|uniref:Acetoacetate--CoA ligase n=1 Tax=Enteractinococcus helveticum TaxID=1837282 RepID=A0A921FNL6_9MICC|nr:acetoacetate--CoA ligase [Enteractinococcus helveticum]HJF14252.1 acetoacetate--CoA ligase [Enteractinococcus helveticum]